MCSYCTSTNNGILLYKINTNMLSILQTSLCQKKEGLAPFETDH